MNTGVTGGEVEAEVGTGIMEGGTEVGPAVEALIIIKNTGGVDMMMMMKGVQVGLL